MVCLILSEKFEQPFKKVAVDRKSGGTLLAPEKEVLFERCGYNKKYAENIDFEVNIGFHSCTNPAIGNLVWIHLDNLYCPLKALLEATKTLSSPPGGLALVHQPSNRPSMPKCQTLIFYQPSICRIA